MQKSVKNVGFHSIGATIRTRRESWCLPYAGFFIHLLDRADFYGKPVKQKMGGIL